LRSDPGYVAFLESYAGAGIYPPDYNHPPYTFMTIFGAGEFDDAFAEPISDEGYYWWCVSYFDHPQRKEDVHYSFAFDATGERPVGVYRMIEPSEAAGVHWYCSNFLEWLRIVVEQQGRLLVLNSKGSPV
jgi:hypothetical protein